MCEKLHNYANLWRHMKTEKKSSTGPNESFKTGKFPLAQASGNRKFGLEQLQNTRSPTPSPLLPRSAVP